MREERVDAYAETETETEPSRDGPALPACRRRGDVVAGKYTLVLYIAKGGMSEVWLATHESLKTQVAIKFVDQALMRDSASAAPALERFRFEAQISARLAAHTRHVVAVHDAGMHEDAPYLVMEYAPARTLETVLAARGPMAPERFADVLDQVADALGAAHALGIVHRDLKPSNLLLVDEPDGGFTVKVADFGVAKALHADPTLDCPRETMAGALVGSPAFMSPEQLGGEGQVDARTDVWAMGVVAYEALTGEPCFEGRSVPELFAAILHARYRPPSSVRPALSKAIGAWIDQALARRPDDRFASVADMSEAFHTAIAASGRRRAAPIAAAALLVTAVLVAGVLAGRRPSLPKASAQAAPLQPATVVASPPPPAAPSASIPKAAEAPTAGADAPPAAETGAARPEPAINVADLPSVEPPSAARPAAAARPSPPRPTAAPPPGGEPRNRKGVDPSEIQ